MADEKTPKNDLRIYFPANDFQCKTLKILSDTKNYWSKVNFAVIYFGKYY